MTKSQRLRNNEGRLQATRRPTSALDLGYPIPEHVASIYQEIGIVTNPSAVFTSKEVGREATADFSIVVMNRFVQEVFAFWIIF